MSTKNIPLVITNARLSKKSAHGYERIAGLTREMLQAVTVLAAQGKKDATRFVALGMPENKIVVTGNLKFDIELPPNLETKSQALRATLGADRLIWVAASTHAGEEELILSAQQKILEKFPTSLLILIPRHPDRFADVYSLAKQKFNVIKRSENLNCESGTQIFLGDTMGEMLLMYSVCDVAFVGGSFVPVGGHNMLEPALLGRPIITGPQLFNFAEISELLIEAKGMQKVENANQLARLICELFTDKSHREQMGLAALNFLENNRGALQKQFTVIENILGASDV